MRCISTLWTGQFMKKIVLCCTYAMSTSLFVQKIKKVIVDKGIQILVEALSLSSAIEQIDSSDWNLIVPQISYAVHDFEKLLRISRHRLDTDCTFST
ncbi:hypothetical protein [Coriobacterium glomerans]|uniref:PTS sugar transporter subunit IIB n=1 Tax=Coriobacterium glomerans TaxID=33871 RepID=UPI0006742CB8